MAGTSLISCEQRDKWTQHDDGDHQCRHVSGGRDFASYSCCLELFMLVWLFCG